MPSSLSTCFSAHLSRVLHRLPGPSCPSALCYHLPPPSLVPTRPCHPLCCRMPGCLDPCMGQALGGVPPSLLLVQLQPLSPVLLPGESPAPLPGPCSSWDTRACSGPHLPHFQPLTYLLRPGAREILPPSPPCGPACSLWEPELEAAQLWVCYRGAWFAACPRSARPSPAPSQS